ncbi:MAG: hypothetical protein R6V57_18400 [Vicinamibacterales bacterium]
MSNAGPGFVAPEADRDNTRLYAGVIVVEVIVVVGIWIFQRYFGS